MKALTFKKYGSPEFLEINEIKKPLPIGDQVLVKVRAASVNDWDWGLLHGKPLVPNRLMAGLFKPRIVLGTDIAGVVESVGSKVVALKPGDEVYGDLSGAGFGGFAEYACVPQNVVKLKSPAMSFAQAASIPHAGMLALQAVNAGGELAPGQRVLINGAGGGVGSIAIQLLKQKGVEVTGVDSETKLEALRKWGFDQVIDYQSEDFTRLNHHYDLIIDVKTERSPADYERVLNTGGVYATLGGRVPELLKVALSGLRINRARDKKLTVIALHANQELAHLNGLFETGVFKPIVDSEFEFSTQGVREAFRHFGGAAHKGKIIVCM